MIADLQMIPILFGLQGTYKLKQNNPASLFCLNWGQISPVNHVFTFSNKLLS